MDLFTLIFVLVAVGVVMWLINTKVPMDNNIRWILNAVVVIVLIIWLLRVFGIAIPNIQI